MTFQSRLRKLRKEKKLTQQEIADKLGITRQAYGYYENEKSKREPDLATIQKLAEIFGVTTDYLLGRTDEKTVKVNVAGKEIELTEKEFNVFKELKKYQLAFHELQSDPEKKVKQLIKMWEVIKMELDEIQDEDKDN